LLTVANPQLRSIIVTSSDTTEVTIPKSNTNLVMSTMSNIQTVIIPENTNQIAIDKSANLVGNTVSTNEYVIMFHVPHTNSVQDDAGIITIPSGTITGPVGWNGIMDLPTITQVTIPNEITTTTTNGITTTTVTSYSETAAFEIGLSGSTLEFSTPVRLEFTDDGGNEFTPFFVGSDGITTFIDTECLSDSALGLTTTGANECFFDNGTDLIVWTDHFTKFGASKKSSSSSSTGGSGGTSGGGRTGVSTSAGGSGIGGFGGILGTSLTINEIFYDKCDEYITRILVSSDADIAPSVVLHTAKSGTISAKLADVQPYEESNKITKVDKYLYEVPIDSDESFLMVVVTEEKGTLKHTVQASVRLSSCEDTIVIAKVPKDEIKETSSIAPRIFDTKFQIDDGKQYRADTESEFYYVDNQDLTVTAIVDSEIPLQRAELRTITMTQSDEDYIAVKMNIESLPISNSTSIVSATIPSQFIQEPGIKYWIHVLDEDKNTSQSKQYSIGVKPTSVSDVIVEMDVPTVRPTGSVVRPELYIKNENSPTFGVVSLIVDGKIVSKKSQLFETGQTKISFDWTIPASKMPSSNELQGRVDLYDKTITTSQALVHSYPKTIEMSSYDMKPLELLVRDDTVLADPALIYASDSNANLQFRVIDPQGQCIIGGTDECLVKENTKNHRGGFASLHYGDQILRVKYSGSDNALERFSITSIDPITGQWTITLETDDGFVPQVHAMQDISVKIKYRYHSETITVKSN